MKVPFIKAIISFQSALCISEVGVYISSILFGGLKFEGMEKNIYDEVPAIFINDAILGLTIVLSGYNGFGENERYILEISPKNLKLKNIFQGQIELEEYNISDYIRKLLAYNLSDNNKIKLL
ncbi:hypothetical protein [Pseudobacteroides cellulosolvens]|uniref:Uncharacterized protein n=1 Tax=Pseudobacteroides cellulosolvens ATCC 35603 = DSM 2933 TaxID=398512 RepID=A0A0L6JW93_9FIRM|nr:hypothetical protein [Pseudobacteroides cellulosolvens]KNY30113.1 hypothetical protein Bccel_5390 [Pseudobacteroides cellulosolvens ATCC 35603 = DSM 2933]